MTEMNVLLLVLAAVLLGMACVRADRVRAWRAGINPSATELPDSAFTVARVLLVTMAGFSVYTAVQGFGVSDGSRWSDQELTSAVEGATASLDGSFTYGDPLEDASADFDGDAYATTLKDEIVEHGGGDAPGFGVDAALSSTTGSDQAFYLVTADGAGRSYCVVVRRAHSGNVETVAPGLSGEAAKVVQPKYTFAVSSRTGTC
ncbi:hypothetical protein K4B79_38045 [Streptomyces lincolnensis]|nr:hypothetical protein [Streptomyces lincolnensis]